METYYVETAFLCSCMKRYTWEYDHYIAREKNSEEIAIEKEEY